MSAFVLLTRLSPAMHWHQFKELLHSLSERT